MPWKECQVMDERLRFVARLLDGEKMAQSARSSEFPAKRATRFSIATRTSGSAGSPIAAGGRIGRSGAPGAE